MVTLNTSSTVVRPSRTSRQPSSASVRMPARRAASRIWSLEAFFRISSRMFVVGVHPFKDGVPAEEAGLPALAATDRAVNRRVRRNADLRLERLRRRANHPAACSAGRARARGAGPAPLRATRRPDTAPRPCPPGGSSAPGASLVCSVEKTKWPVSEACTAICAVSGRGFRRSAPRPGRGAKSSAARGRRSAPPFRRPESG